MTLDEPGLKEGYTEISQEAQMYHLSDFILFLIITSIIVSVLSIIGGFFWGIGMNFADLLF